MPDSAKQGEHQVQVALKYLDIARAEILDRMKGSNQILSVYVAGVGAITAWMYQATIGSDKHASMRSLVFPTGVVVAFLALAATWIIFHNERMVNALARYQKEELAPYLKSVAPGMTMWEASDALHDTDNRLPIAATIIVQGILVIGPSAVFLCAMLYFYLFAATDTVPKFETGLEVPAILLTAALTRLAILLTDFTIMHRR